MALTPNRPNRSQPGTWEPADQLFVLRLYTAGASPNSLQAITNIQNLCARHLNGRCQLQVVDIYQQPQRAALDRIVALPMLVKQLPAPLRRLFGSLSDSGQVLAAFRVAARPVDPADDVANGE